MVTEIMVPCKLALRIWKNQIGSIGVDPEDHNSGDILEFCIWKSGSIIKEPCDFHLGGLCWVWCLSGANLVLPLGG